MTTSPDPLGCSEPEAASAEIGRLFEAHGRMVVGLCRFLLRDRVEAEDAAQQTFVAAHRSLLRGSIPRDAAAWLATIARNECRARIRQRMREPLVLRDADEGERQLPDPFYAAAENADLEALRAGLQALPESQRHAFVLREFAGLSYHELSRALEVTEPAVESLLVRARTRLRLALTHANPLVIPVVLRDQFVRLTTCWDDGSVGGVAKIASLPFAAKLAVAGTGAVLAVAGGAGVERLGDGHRVTHARPAIDARRPTAVVAHKVVVHPLPARPAASVTRVRTPLRSHDHGGVAVRGHAGSGRSVVRSGPSETAPSGESRDGSPSGDDGRLDPVVSTPSVSSGSSGDAAASPDGQEVAGAPTSPVEPATSTSSSGPGDGGTSTTSGESVSGSSGSGSDHVDGASSDGHGSGSGSTESGGETTSGSS